MKVSILSHSIVANLVVIGGTNLMSWGWVMNAYCNACCVTRRKKKLARMDMRAVLLAWKKSEVRCAHSFTCYSEGWQNLLLLAGNSKLLSGQHYKPLCPLCVPHAAGLGVTLQVGVPLCKEDVGLVWVRLPLSWEFPYGQGVKLFVSQVLWLLLHNSVNTGFVFLSRCDP